MPTSIAKNCRMSLPDLVASIDLDREHGNLSSALRRFVLNHYQTRLRERVGLAA
jgi:predicted DNA-binding ribbon-helix-helix protein